MLELIGSAFEWCNDPPWASVGKLELVYLLASSVRPNSAACKNDVTNQMYAWVRSARIDVFTMISALLLYQQFGNVAAG